MSGDVPLLLDLAPHVAGIRLRRPEERNRFEPRDLDVLMAHCEAIDARADVLAVVLAAEGEVFSAGYDLDALMREGSDHTARVREDGARTFEAAADRLARLRPVLIAAMEGGAIGGATDMALACDLRIGTPRASMHMPAARFGIPLYASALERYVHRLGLDLAKRLIFLAEKVEAEALLKAGFLTELVREGQAEARALEIATEIARLPPAPLAAMKRALNAFAAGAAVTREVRADLAGAYDPAETARRVVAFRAARS